MSEQQQQQRRRRSSRGWINMNYDELIKAA